MSYTCKQCGRKAMNYSGGSNGGVKITDTNASTPLPQRARKLVPGNYTLNCVNCGNKETHQFNWPETIQGQLKQRAMQDF
jgi:hypothetical protein